MASWLLVGCGTTVVQNDDARDDIGDGAVFDSEIFDAGPDATAPVDSMDAGADVEASRDVPAISDLPDILQPDSLDAADIVDVISFDRPNDTGSCRADTMALFCGVNHCNVCTAPAHAVAHCNGDTCATDLQCEAGFDDCDRSQNNGCEISLQNDSNHCGRCGGVCSAPAHARPICTNGACGFECTGGWVRSGAMCVVPPVGLRRPLSSTVLVGDRPLYRWAPLEAAEAYRIEICRTRECVGADVVETAIVRGANVYQQQNYRLDSRIHFWRVHALVGGVTESSSPTWEFRSVNPRSRIFPAQQRYSTLLDLDGDGDEEFIVDESVDVGGLPSPGLSVYGWDQGRANGTLMGRMNCPEQLAGCGLMSRFGDVNGDGAPDWGVLRFSVGAQPTRRYFAFGGRDIARSVQNIVELPLDLPVHHWVGDINDDGYQDVVGVARRGDQRRVELIVGSSSGFPMPSSPLTDWIDSAVSIHRVLEDYNGDGRPELLLSGIHESVGVYAIVGQPLQLQRLANGTGRNVWPTPLGDVNGDGVPDEADHFNDEIVLVGPDGSVAQRLPLIDPRVEQRTGRGPFPIGDANLDGTEDSLVFGWIENGWAVDVYLGSRDSTELQTRDYSLRGVIPRQFSSGALFLGNGLSFLDFRGDGDPYLAIGRFPGTAMVYHFTERPPPGDLPQADIVFRVTHPSITGMGTYLTLAPALTAPRYTTPSLYPSVRFLLPSQQPPRALRFLFSHSLNQSSIGHTMGDYS